MAVVVQRELHDLGGGGPFAGPLGREPLPARRRT